MAAEANTAAAAAGEQEDQLKEMDKLVEEEMYELLTDVEETINQAAE